MHERVMFAPIWLYIWPSGLTFSFGKQLAELALAHRLPSIHPF